MSPIEYILCPQCDEKIEKAGEQREKTGGLLFAPMRPDNRYTPYLSGRFCLTLQSHQSPRSWRMGSRLIVCLTDARRTPITTVSGLSCRAAKTDSIGGEWTRTSDVVESLSGLDRKRPLHAGSHRQTRAE